MPGSVADIAYDATILDLTNIASEVAAIFGETSHDFATPDGAPRKSKSGRKLRDLAGSPSIAPHAGAVASYK